MLISSSIARCVVGALLWVAVTASAATYNFKVSSAAQNLPQITTAGSYVFVDVQTDASAPNVVLFRFTSRIPQPISGIGRISFDTGSDKQLFASMAVHSKFNTDMVPTSLSQHPYLSNFQPAFSFGLAGGGQIYDPRLLQPGDIITFSAVLGPGRTFNHVLQALAQGASSNPTFARGGLRIGFIAYHLLGRRPDPKKTIMDDAGFVHSSMVRP